MPLCVSFVCSIEVSVHCAVELVMMQWVVLVSLLCCCVYFDAYAIVLVLLYLVSYGTMKRIEFFSSTWLVIWFLEEYIVISNQFSITCVN